MYKLNDDRMFYDVAEGQAIVIDSSTGLYFAMNMLATNTFDYIVKGASIDKIAQKLKELPGCPEDVDTALESFVAQLLGHEILIAHDSSFEGSIDASTTWFMEGYDFMLECYKDVADMILADPVHDVDVEFGWPVVEGE